MDGVRSGCRLYSAGNESIGWVLELLRDTQLEPLTPISLDTELSYDYVSNHLYNFL